MVSMTKVSDNSKGQPKPTRGGHTEEQGPLLANGGHHGQSYNAAAQEKPSFPRALCNGDEEEALSTTTLEDGEQGVGRLVRQGTSNALGDKVQACVMVSIAFNLVLSGLNLYATISSGSLAVLASLVDTLLDLISQAVLSVTESMMRKPSDAHFPAGRSRIEPVGVIIVSVIMGIAALELLRNSVDTLISAWGYHHYPSLHMTPLTIGILITSVVVKICLCMYSTALARQGSGTAKALSEDHRNDVMTNGFSVVSSVLAHYNRRLWFCDPIGAMVISSLIMYNWVHVGIEHIHQVVGISAPQEIFDTIAEMASNHHKDLQLDLCRAYHHGARVLVELEVILPAEMCVKEAHDIALSLQQRVESLEQVERCFVHTDYMAREENEHKV